MSNTYFWTVSSLECYPEQAGQTDVVFQVNWICSGISSETYAVTYPNGTTAQVPYSGSISNKTPVTYTAGSSFTPYSQLTQEQIIGWVQSALGEQGVQDVETNVGVQISEQTNPTSVTPPLPWATPTA